MRTGNVAKAQTHYDEAFKLLDFLIEKDAENFDYVKIRGEAKFEYADELLRNGETEKAYLEMSETARQTDAKYDAALEYIYAEKLGNCSLAESHKDRSKLNQAVAEYQKAVNIWRENGALNFYGIEQKEKLPILERKIARLQNS